MFRKQQNSRSSDSQIEALSILQLELKSKTINPLGI